MPACFQPIPKSAVVCSLVVACPRFADSRQKLRVETPRLDWPMTCIFSVFYTTGEEKKEKESGWFGQGFGDRCLHNNSGIRYA